MIFWKRGETSRKKRFVLPARKKCSLRKGTPWVSMQLDILKKECPCCSSDPEASILEAIKDSWGQGYIAL